jgi:hypothetical protein
LSEYGGFVEVLRASLLHQELLWWKKISFLEYWSVQLDLLWNRHLYNKIDFITRNHLHTVNEIYKNPNKRKLLYEIIKDYLY